MLANSANNSHSLSHSTSLLPSAHPETLLFLPFLFCPLQPFSALSTGFPSLSDVAGTAAVCYGGYECNDAIGTVMGVVIAGTAAALWLKALCLLI